MGGTKAVSVTVTLLLQPFLLSINAALFNYSQCLSSLLHLHKDSILKRQIFAQFCLKLGVSHAAIKGNGSYSQVYIYHINKWNIDCEGRSDSPLSIA